MAQLLIAKPVIEKLKKDLVDQTNKLKERNIIPSMKVLLVGNHAPSLTYTRNKKKFCESIGADCEIIHLDENITKQKFISELKSVASNDLVDGLFVQLPLPKHLQDIEVSDYIPPSKDVDGFHPDNFFKILSNNESDALLPCTPKGIITLLKEYNLSLEGKHVVIIGRSMIVGKPMAILATNQNATVTLCHSKTVNLKSYTQQADVIITALGKANFLTKEYINQNKKPIIIDVGINYNNKSLCGDANFNDIEPLVSAITPVPGGVGPMTILSLVQNLLKAASNRK